MHVALLTAVLAFTSCKQGTQSPEVTTQQARKPRKPLPTTISVHGTIRTIEFQDLSKYNSRSNYYTYITLDSAKTTPAIYGQLLINDHVYLRPTISGVDRSLGTGDTVELTVSTALREGRNIIYDLQPG